jgi:hypothetical protein
MGVTIYPVSHPANPLSSKNKNFCTNAKELIFDTHQGEHLHPLNKLIQCSFDPSTSPKLVAKSNGFVQTCITAYSDHHHLIIRPDDVWITILTQLSLYINAHAEELRSHFVQHEGQKMLLVEMDGDRYSCSWDKIVKQFTDQLGESVNDPTLKSWLLQEFSTTTETDRAVCAIAMMGSLQAYFSYYAMLRCGIPSVTLEGTREDWVKLRDAFADPKWLPTFGEETKEWCRVLGVVLNRFVESYDYPSSLTTKSFWNNIAHYSGRGSGARYWSGWITAFCFWNDKGECLRDHDSLLAKGGIGSMVKSALPNWLDTTLRIDGQVFHKINSGSVPPARVSVPVTINELGTEYKARMVAGVVGFEVSESGKKLEHGIVGMDTLQPHTGWGIYEERP